MDKQETIFRELLASKMEQAELPVSDSLWTAIESQLPAAIPAAAASTGAVAKWVALKWVGGFLVAAGLAYGIVQLTGENREETQPKPAEIVTPSSSVSTEESANEVSQPTIDGKDIKESTSTTKTGLNTPISASMGSADSGNEPQFENIPTTNPELVLTTLDRDSSDSNSEVSPAEHPSEQTPDVNSAPFSALFSQKIVDESQLRWLFIPQEDRAIEYVWEFGDGSVSTSMAGAHTYSEEGEYTVKLTVRDESGKEESQEVKIEVVRPGSFHAANVFTPNGDFKNDVFDPMINSINIARLSRWIIFNAEGKTVFESTSQFTWDGQNMSGEACPAGTYRYVIQAIDTRNNPMENTGTLRLLRK